MLGVRGAGHTSQQIILKARGLRSREGCFSKMRDKWVPRLQDSGVARRISGVLLEDATGMLRLMEKFLHGPWYTKPKP